MFQRIFPFKIRERNHSLRILNIAKNERSLLTVKILLYQKEIFPVRDTEKDPSLNKNFKQRTYHSLLFFNYNFLFSFTSNF